MTDICKKDRSMDLREYRQIIKLPVHFERPAPRIFEEKKIEVEVDRDSFKEN